MIKLKTWFWILGGLLIFRIALSLNPEWMDAVYREGIFVLIRWLLDMTFGILPIPGVLLFLFLLAWPFVRPYIYPKMRIKKRGAMGKRILKFCVQVTCFFLLLWGMNYGASEMEDRYSTEGQILSDDLDEAYRFQIAQSNKLGNRDLSLPGHVDKAMSKQIRKSLVKILREDGWAHKGNPTCRLIFSNSGILRKLGIHGIYFPFTGEGYVDASLPFIQQAFTYAHEMAHGFGIANEGDCNWFAYKALSSSENPQLRYAAHFVAMRYMHWAVMNDDIDVNEDVYLKLYSTKVMHDLEAIHENNLKYETWFPQLAEASNNAYLRLNGNEDGIKSYDQLVEWLVRLDPR